MEIADGRYRLIRRLGSGGTSEVYGGVDCSLGRAVAIKMLRPEVAAAVLGEEGRALAQLNHPNIVAVHDLVQWEGRSYLVMEYVDGIDLEQRLHDGGSIERDQALALFGAVAGAVGHAHAHGIRHGDLKPANILLAADGTVKLTDFTLAGVAGASVGVAAPEQMRGELADERTDVYGLGRLLARLLGPLDGQSPDDAGLLAAISRATAPDPSDRFPSVGTLLAALPALPVDLTRLTGTSPLADLTRVLPRRVQETGPVRRRRWPAVAGMGAAAMLLFAGLVNHFTARAATPMVTVPNLMATGSNQARFILRSLTLHARIDREYASAPAGTVVGQRPHGAARVDQGSAVTLAVSRGPRPVVVVGVTGDAQAAAIARLHHLGLRVRVVTQDTVFQSAGTILDQQPAEGTTVLPGTTVTLTVSTKPWWWPF